MKRALTHEISIKKVKNTYSARQRNIVIYYIYLINFNFQVQSFATEMEGLSKTVESEIQEQKR